MVKNWDDKPGNGASTGNGDEKVQYLSKHLASGDLGLDVNLPAVDIPDGKRFIIEQVQAQVTTNAIATDTSVAAMQVSLTGIVENNYRRCQHLHYRG